MCAGVSRPLINPVFVLKKQQLDLGYAGHCVFRPCFVSTHLFVHKVKKTSERIDIEKLKAREQIMFFDDVLLFEDELHDHGVSMISVKIVSPVHFSKTVPLPICKHIGQRHTESVVALVWFSLPNSRRHNIKHLILFSVHVAESDANQFLLAAAFLLTSGRRADSN